MILVQFVCEGAPDYEPYGGRRLFRKTQVENGNCVGEFTGGLPLPVGLTEYTGPWPIGGDDPRPVKMNAFRWLDDELGYNNELQARQASMSTNPELAPFIQLFDSRITVRLDLTSSFYRQFVNALRDAGIISASKARDLKRLGKGQND